MSSVFCFFPLSDIYFLLASVLSVFIAFPFAVNHVVFLTLPRVYVFLVYSLNASLAGCTPAHFYGPGSNTHTCFNGHAKAH